jgi:hypothetical protein
MLISEHSINFIQWNTFGIIQALMAVCGRNMMSGRKVKVEIIALLIDYIVYGLVNCIKIRLSRKL